MVMTLVSECERVRISAASSRDIDFEVTQCNRKIETSRSKFRGVTDRDSMMRNHCDFVWLAFRSRLIVQSHKKATPS